MKKWNWHEMIAALRQEDIDWVVTGPNGSSGGLIGCTFSPRPGSYTHTNATRAVAAGAQPTEIPLEWDFVIHRADGTGVRMHPRYKEKEIPCYELHGHDEQVAPPAAGIGRSDGRGTFQQYLALGVVRRPSSLSS